MDKEGLLIGVAIKILGESPSPLRPGRIVGRAMTAGLLAPDSKSAKAVMQNILDYDIEHNCDKSAFVRTPSGHYGLNKSRALPPTNTSVSSPADMTMRLKDAATATLGGALTPLPLEMIVDRAIYDGLIRPSLRTFSLVLEEEILKEMHREKSRSKFVRTETGHYGLRSLQGSYGLPDIGPVPATSSSQPNPFPRARYDSEDANAPTTHDFEPDLTPGPEDFSILAKPLTKQPGDDPDPHPLGDYVGKAGEHIYRRAKVRAAFLDARVQDNAQLAWGGWHDPAFRRVNFLGETHAARRP